MGSVRQVPGGQRVSGLIPADQDQGALVGEVQFPLQPREYAHEAITQPLDSAGAIAGPAAEELRSGTLPDTSIDWLKTNFFKTELELGHCLRLPSEGPCECDLYLTCVKFITTPEYAPRLQTRRQIEQTLALDAAERGWDREVERHRCAIERIEKLLADLGQPFENQNDTPADPDHDMSE